MKNDCIVLAVENLRREFKENNHVIKALQDISFNLYQGEFLAVMGTSGSGKSTLLNILGAMDHPTAGEVKVNGFFEQSMFTEPKATIYRRENVGFIFQSFNLLKDLSVEENIALPLILKGEKDSTIEAKVKEMMDMVGLTKWKTHRPVKLSGGQQQRVAIGRALITSPPIVLADEPTGNLDFNTSTDILNILVDMKKKFNQSIIMVTHDPHVSTYADRVLFFHDGKIVDEFKCMKNEDDMEVILQKFKYILEQVS